MYMRIRPPDCSTKRTTSPTGPPPTGASSLNWPPPIGTSLFWRSGFALVGSNETNCWFNSTTAESLNTPRYTPAKRLHDGSQATVDFVAAEAFATADPTICIKC